MLYRRTIFWPAVAVGLTLAQVAPAQQPRSEDGVRALLACRPISDDAVRLRCLDARIAELQAQMDRGDVVVATRSAIAEARQAQFGRSGQDLAAVPARPRQSVAPLPTSIDTSIRSVGATPDGKWVMVLADGARWQQIDGRTLARDPKPGMAIAIRRAAMGSYLANVAGQPAMRVRRVN
jgi:hypothetical protein